MSKIENTEKDNALLNRNNFYLPDDIENDTTTCNNQHRDSFNYEICICHNLVDVCRCAEEILTMYLQS